MGDGVGCLARGGVWFLRISSVSVPECVEGLGVGLEVEFGFPMVTASVMCCCGKIIFYICRLNINKTQHKF